MDSYGECPTVCANSRDDCALARWREKAKDTDTESDGGQVAAQRIVHVDLRTGSSVSRARASNALRASRARANSLVASRPRGAQK